MITLDSSCAAEFNLTVLILAASNVASPDSAASSNSFGSFLSWFPRNLPAPYNATPTPKPLAVATSFSSGDVKNCAVPKIPPTAAALFKAVASAISLPFSLICLRAAVTSALIKSNFLGSDIVPASFLIISISSSTFL